MEFWRRPTGSLTGACPTLLRTTARSHRPEAGHAGVVRVQQPTEFLGDDREISPGRFRRRRAWPPGAARPARPAGGPARPAGLQCGRFCALRPRWRRGRWLAHPLLAARRQRSRSIRRRWPSPPLTWIGMPTRSAAPHAGSARRPRRHGNNQPGQADGPPTIAVSPVGGYPSTSPYPLGIDRAFSPATSVAVPSGCTGSSCRCRRRSVAVPPWSPPPTRLRRLARATSVASRRSAAWVPAGPVPPRPGRWQLPSRRAGGVRHPRLGAGREVVLRGNGDRHCPVGPRPQWAQPPGPAGPGREPLTVGSLCQPVALDQHRMPGTEHRSLNRPGTSLVGKPTGI